MDDARVGIRNAMLVSRENVVLISNELDDLFQPLTMCTLSGLNHRSGKIKAANHNKNMPATFLNGL